MSPFTDEDLIKAKKELLIAARCEYPFPNLEALIIRLEAAEKAREMPTYENVEAWRKAAGK